MNANLIAQSLYRQVCANHGGTSWLGQAHTTGYCVALKGYEMTFNCKGTASEVQAAIRFYFNTLSSATADAIGIWENDGKYYLDSVVWISDRTNAIQFGKLNEQLAIYDIENQIVIDL